MIGTHSASSRVSFSTGQCLNERNKFCVFNQACIFFLLALPNVCFQSSLHFLFVGIANVFTQNSLHLVVFVKQNSFHSSQIVISISPEQPHSWGL